MYIFIYVYIMDNLFSFNSSMNIFINKNSGKKKLSIHNFLYKQILKTYSEITSTPKLIEEEKRGPVVSSYRPEAQPPRLASKPKISGGKNYYTVFFNTTHTHIQDEQITTLRIYKLTIKLG